MHNKLVDSQVRQQAVAEGARCGTDTAVAPFGVCFVLGFVLFFFIHWYDSTWKLSPIFRSGGVRQLPLGHRVHNKASGPSSPRTVAERAPWD